MQRLTKIKYTIYACLLFVALYSVSSFILYSKITDDSKSINLLEKSPRNIFGSLNYNSGIIEVQLDDFGIGLLLFSVDSFVSDDYSQLELQIDNLPKNYQIKLVLVVNGSSHPIELPLLQPNGSRLNQILSRNNLWQENIQQIGLRFLPQKHLGLAKTNIKPILLKSAVLNNKGYFENYFSLLHYWLNYEPWNYRSINHLKASNFLPFYAQPMVVLLTWLVLSWGLFFLLKAKKINALFLMFAAWFSLDILFLNNTFSLNQWSTVNYSTKDKIYPDDDLYKISNAFKSILGLEKLSLEDIRHIKIIIDSPNSYQRLRLIYHLLPLNSNFVNTHMRVDKNSNIKADTYILSYNSNGKPQAPLNNRIKLQTYSVKVKPITKGNNYSITQVID